MLSLTVYIIIGLVILIRDAEFMNYRTYDIVKAVKESDNIVLGQLLLCIILLPMTIIKWLFISMYHAIKMLGEIEIKKGC